MKNSLVVTNLDGKEVTINVIDIIENSEDGKEYICYTIENLEQIFISTLEENESGYNLGMVTEEEKQIVEEVLKQNINKEESN